jgi:Mn-dependent DtxR family transcriptional regulator
MATRGPKAQVTQEKLLEVVRKHENPFVTSSEIAKSLDVERQTAYKYLERATEEGVLEKEKVGGSAAIYWLPERVN